MRTVVTSGDRDVVVSWDDRPPPERRFGALAVGRAVDEIDGSTLATTTELLPMGVAGGVASEVAEVSARDGAFGSFGVVGVAAVALRTVPSRVPARLRSQDYDVRVAAPGHLPMDVTLTVDPDRLGGLPGEPLTVALHRRPTTISGSCTLIETATIPKAPVKREQLADAVVEVVAAFGPSDGGAPAGVPSLGPRRWIRSMAASSVRLPVGTELQRVTTGEHEVGGAATTRLARPTRPGDTVVQLESTDDLGAGSVLRLDDGDLVGVSEVRPTSLEVVVAEALTRALPIGAPVAVVTAVAEGPAVSVDDTVEPGDCTVVVTPPPIDPGLGPDPRFDEVDDVRFTAPVVGGAPVVIYRRVAAYSARSDPHGAFRLPPVHRVATVQLRVRAGGTVFDVASEASATVDVALEPTTHQFVQLTVTLPPPTESPPTPPTP